MWDLAGARARFGRYLAVDVNGGAPPVADVICSLAGAARRAPSTARLQQGLAVRLRLQRARPAAELDLGDDGRFWPSDEALARWQHDRRAGQAAIVYE
ncbi:MAG: hypothetical protein MZW92_10615 [Comamonadaceae bacterium]|nr:hypothetical protein [Comamonadaceae bacterium]